MVLLSGSNKVICVCKCPKEDEKAKVAFSLLFPDEKMPKLLVGRSQILTLSERFPNMPVSAHAHAMARNKEKFEYYIEYDDKGYIIEEYNLITGSKLA